MSEVLKRELKNWERKFQQEHGRKPLKPDIDAASPEISAKYKQYAKMSQPSAGSKRTKKSVETKQKQPNKTIEHVEDEEVIEATPVKKAPAAKKSPIEKLKQSSIFGRHLNKSKEDASSSINVTENSMKEVDDMFGDQLDRQVGRGHLSRELGHLPHSPRNAKHVDSVSTPVKVFKKTHFGQGPLDFVSPRLRPGHHVGLGSPFQPRFMSPGKQQYLLHSPAVVLAQRKLQQQKEMEECMKELENEDDEGDDDQLIDEKGSPTAIKSPANKPTDLEYALETLNQDVHNGEDSEYEKAVPIDKFKKSKRRKRNLAPVSLDAELAKYHQDDEGVKKRKRKKNNHEVAGVLLKINRRGKKFKALNHGIVDRQQPLFNSYSTKIIEAEKQEEAPTEDLDENNEIKDQVQEQQEEESTVPT